MQFVIQIILTAGLLFFVAFGNERPIFIHDMDEVQISDQTEPGTVIYRLLAEDAESEVEYGINGTDAFEVDARTGIVTLGRFLNKEREPFINCTVICHDLRVDQFERNTVSVAITVDVVHVVNENSPNFDPLTIPELEIDKKSPIGTVLSSYSASDIDSVGRPLAFVCEIFQGQLPIIDFCPYVTLVYKNQTERSVVADLVSVKSLEDIEDNRFYFQLNVTVIHFTAFKDGIYSSTITVGVNFVTNSSVATVKTEEFTQESRGTERSSFEEPIEGRTQFVTDAFLIDTDNQTFATNENYEISETTLVENPLLLLHSDVTVSNEQVDAKEKHKLRFSQGEINVEIIENWPQSYPLPLTPRPRIIYDSFNEVQLSVKIISPESMHMDNNNFIIEPSVLSAERSFDVVVVNSTVLDRERVSRLKLMIEAIDPVAEQQSSMVITVNIVDVNDNRPTFSQNRYSMALEDNANKDKFIGRVWANDSDSDLFGTNGIVFHIIGPWAKYFRLVDSRPGAIDIYANPCDPNLSSDCLTYKNMPDQIVMVVRATDTNGTGLYTDIPLMINITRVNVAKPKFVHNSYFTKLKEKDRQMDPIIILEATDEDSTKLTYGLEDPTRLFGIDNDTGLLFVSKPEHVTIKNLGVRFTIVGTVSDGQYLEKVKIIVEILPNLLESMENKPPMFTSSMYSTTVPPNAQEGYIIINVIAHDPENQAIQYYMTMGGANYFSIKRETGEIIFSGARFKSQQNFTIHVIAIDGGTPQAYSTTTVLIYCIGQGTTPPRFDQNVSVAWIFENATVGTALETPKLIDEDAEDKFFVQIASIQGFNGEGRPLPTDLSELFRYDSGVLHLNRSILNTGLSAVHLELTAADYLHPLEDTARTFIVINVIQSIKVEVESFAFLGLLPNKTFHLNISLDAPANAFVYHFRILDNYFSSEIVYSLKNSTDLFALDEKSGLLTLKRTLTKADPVLMPLEIEAFNLKTKQFIDARFAVHLVEKQTFVKLALNQDNYFANVVENVPIGGFVLRLSETTKFCAFYEYNLSGPDDSYFYVDDQARILTASKIDREQRQSFLFEIEVSCKSLVKNMTSIVIPAKAPVVITVIDLNDNPPVFDREMYSVSIQESLPVGSHVITVMAKDPDVGINGTVLYALTGVSKDLQDRISIDSIEGQIKTVQDLRGLSGSYQFSATATDGGNLNTTVSIDLVVRTSNKCIPKFVIPNETNTILYVEENHASGVQLINVKAVTEDPNCTLKYKFIDRSTDQLVTFTNEFQINSDTGKITPRKPLDREMQKSYKLIVSAVNDSQKNDTIPVQIAIQINVLDLNDNVPVFQPPPAFAIENCSSETASYDCWFHTRSFVYNFSIFENESPGSVLGKIKARDSDEGVNSVVYYHLADGFSSDNFDLNITSGQLKTTKSFDREKQDRLETFVFATNNRSRPSAIEQHDLLTLDESQNVAKISLNVLDRNDNGPSFGRKLYLAAIPFDIAPETLVTRIQAIDPDVSGGVVSYKLKKTAYHYKKTVVDERQKFFVNIVTGEVNVKSRLNEFSQGYFQLQIDAMNEDNSTFNANLTDTAFVKVWIFEPSSQLVKIVINESPLNITEKAETITKSIGDLLRANVVLQQINYNKNEDGTISPDRVDLLAVFIERANEEIMSTDRVLSTVDKLGIKSLSSDIVDLRVVEILPAKSTKPLKSGRLSGAAIALIVFGCILFLGLLVFLFLLSYLKYSFMNQLKTFRTLEPQNVSVTPSMIIASKENPLWSEVEKKPYEEQELSLPMPNEEHGYKRNSDLHIRGKNDTLNSLSEIDTVYAKVHKPLSSRYSQASSITDYDGTNLYQTLRK